MRRFLAAAGAALLGIGYRLLERHRDETNIQRLAAHIGCSQEDAKRLYLLARQEGYGAAYRKVFHLRNTEPLPDWLDDPTPIVNGQDVVSQAHGAARQP